MRARSLAIIGCSLLLLLVASVPLAASASTVIKIGANVITHVTVSRYPSFTYAGTTYQQSAFRSGQSVPLSVTVLGNAGTPTVSARFNVTGAKAANTAQPTATSSGNRAGFISYQYHLSPVVQGLGTTNGLRTIRVTASAPLFSTEGFATTSVLLDNTPPTVSFTSATASMTASGLHLSLSGAASGTGSAVRALALRGIAVNASNTPVRSSTGGAPTFLATNVSAITQALAASSTKTFRDVPITVPNVPGGVRRAIALQLTLAVADQAGNVATTSITVSLPSTRPRLSSVLFIPGTEASRLYGRTRIGLERQIWEPSFFTDTHYLAMRSNGTSKYGLYTKDIVNSLEANNLPEAKVAQILGATLQVYGKFETFMNKLVASSTVDMAQWRAYPYDWRYSPTEIVNNGTLVESGGTVQRVYLANLVAQMASSSATGKVTIVAHSNGGLLAKALLQKLQTEGKTNEVDRLIMVGTPQWGTPSDIGVMLHGDGQTQGLGVVLQAASARSVTQWLPDAYALLPSPAYFAHVGSAVVDFLPGHISSKYAAAYGKSIHTYSALTRFLENVGKVHATTTRGDLYQPLALHTSLITKAAASHARLDNWTPPPHVAVIAIAGWGQETIAGLAYTTSKTQPQHLEHQPILTQDGDGTVVAPSALGSMGQQLYFDASAYAKDGNANIVHQDLMAAVPVQRELVDLLEHKDVTLPQYIRTTKPKNGNRPLLQISSHSPVHLLVSNSTGKHTGIVAIPGIKLALASHGIPGASVQMLDDEEYVTLPQNASYQVTATGYATGTATIDIATVSGKGFASTTAELANVPVAASSTIAFAVKDGTPSAATIRLGASSSPSFTVPASAFSSSPIAYLKFIQTTARNMQLPKNVKRELLLRLSGIIRALNFRQHARVFSQHFLRAKSIDKEPGNFFAKAQITALERWIQQSARTPKIPSRFRRFFERLRHRHHLSKTDAQTLIRMLNYSKTLLS